MDQLKQVLKYQFWILLGIALILPLVGWAMSRSGMMADASERAKKLSSLDSSLTATQNDPNDDWAKSVEVINREQEKQKDLAWGALYELQAPFHVWPANMPDDPAKIDTMHQDIYSRTGYVSEIERIRKIVKPVDEDGQNGLVVFPEELLPALQEGWKFQAPSRAEIEAAQEDIWLYTALLSAIARVNDQAPSVYDAPVREIVELLLRGGGPKGSAAGGSGGTGGVKAASGGSNAGLKSGGQEMMMMKSVPGISMAGGADAGGVGGVGGVGGGQDVKINLDEELGPERPASDTKSDAKPGSAASGGGAASKIPSGGAMSMMSEGIQGLSSGMGTSGRSGRGGGANINRYCEDKKKEWKTRGFSLEVVMDHRRVPDLLVELSNCPGWPINILRVHVADTQDEDLVRDDGGGGLGGMGMAGGPPGGRFGGGPMGGPDMMKMMAPRKGAARAAAPEGLGAPPGLGGRPKPAAGRDSEDFEVGETSSANRPSPLDDPNLARVAIVGVIYIFNQPKEPPAAAPGSQPQSAPAAAPVAAAPAQEDTAAASPAVGDASRDAEEEMESKSADGESADEPADRPSTDSGKKDESEAKPQPEGKSAAGEPKGTN
ncbi:MAG: hypothetical protein ACM3U2_19155 [Deltaproteobacteria bacterium]